MSGLTFTPMRLEGLQKVTPFYAEDLRGYFLKIYEKGAFRGAGIDGEIWESCVMFCGGCTSSVPIHRQSW